MDIEKLISIINSKRAMLFCGAGFSFGSTNLNGRSPLNSKGLSKAFSTASGIPENDNLYFTSEYLLDKMGSRYIIDFLKKEYTTPKIADHHKIICSLPWRRIYTTNYDNIIEQSYLDGAFQLNSVDIDDNPSDFFQSGNMCLHINGSISNLSDSTLNSSFRLTDSSYISAESFHNSPWFSIFKRDLDKSEAIVFIGYSLYDFEIKKLLKENEFYKAKTFFICAPEPNFEETFILGKYGTTFPIGVSGFSDEITKCKNEENVTHAIDYHLVSLSKYEITDRHEIEIKDNDIENMLSYGVIDDESIDEFVLGNIKTPFLIKRNTTNLIADTLLRAGGHVVVYGALGNGKSFLLRQLKTLLCSNGLSVYVLDDIDADYVSDIDYLSSLNSKNIIFIDGYDKYLPVIEYISRTNQKNIRLVISARVAEHEYGRKKLSLYNLKYKEFNIDILDESEIEQFIDCTDLVIT